MFNSYDKFSINFKKVIQRAAWLCLNELKKVITSEHLFLGVASVPESTAYQILQKLGISEISPAEQAQESFSSINPKIDYNEVFSLSMDKSAIAVLERATDFAIELNHQTVGTGHLLYALLVLHNAVLLSALQRSHRTPQQLEIELKRALMHLEIAPRHHLQISDQKPPANSTEKKQRKLHPMKKIFSRDEFKPTPALDFFTTDLTTKERYNKLVPLVGREKEIERLINILSRKNKNNPLLLGDPGVGKTAIVEGLARRIHDGEMPDILAHKKILHLDLNAIVAGTMYRGEFENRLKQIIDELKVQDDVILFIDEIHNLIGAGSASGSMDAANILKPYLARGEISCIGATTPAEYKAHMENDATLERRFQIIAIEEPTLQQTKEIILGLRKHLETYHRISITEEAIDAAVDLSERFLPNKFFPDKAIDLIDEACSRAKVENVKDAYAKQIRDIKVELKILLGEKEEAVRQENFSEAISFKEKEERLLNTLDTLKKKQKHEHQKKVGTIQKNDISQIITEMIKIPFLEMTNINNKKLLRLEEILGARVLGQKKVLHEISKALRRSEAGLADPKRPLASFIFLGPSGVGKTETAKAIAEEVFGDKNALIRINMSEFQESFNVTKLIGAPAGYIGYKESNQLADKVRQKPYAAVLFDEMEKAHPDVFNLLLQVLEDGYLVDAGGKQINFKNTVIIFTSNIGLERFNKTQQLGFSAASKNEKEQVNEQFQEVKKRILEELYNSYRVEFLNRIDKILVFEPLSQKTLNDIVDLTIQNLNKRLLDKNLSVEISVAAKKRLAKKSFSPDDGARSVRRIVQEEIEERLVERILKGSIKNGAVVKIGVKGKKITIAT